MIGATEFQTKKWRKRTAFKDAQIVPVEIVKDRETKGDDSHMCAMSD